MAKGSVLGKLISIVIVLAIAGGVAFLGVKFFKKDGEAIQFQKGMVYATWTPEAYQNSFSDKSLEKLKGLGVNWIAIVVTWYQDNAWATQIRRTSKTPTDESLTHVIRKSHELGMKVMLKPHLDLLDKSDGSWRGEIGFTDEAEWDKWFKSYTEYILHYADISKKEDVELFCLGTELSVTAVIKPHEWKALIKKVRGKYSGLLTYAAHWDRYFDIRFWDALDYVGINSYFPLSEKKNPTYNELQKGWKRWVDEMDEFYQQVQKPIIFPECGCSSADGAAIRPWEHLPSSDINLTLQENYYRALLSVFWNKEWFYGLYWWYWGTNVRMGGKHERRFTPQNKPAQEVIKKWYAKPVIRPEK